MRDDFAVFILTHGRADTVLTKKALDAQGYTGKIYYVVDNEDDQIEKYKANFGAENVIVFDKQKAVDRTDTMDSFNEHRAIVYARNECFKIAKNLGLTYFLELDDDYTRFEYRTIRDGKLSSVRQKKMGRVFDLMLDFLDASGAKTVALAQGGDFVGGAGGGNFTKGCLRKAMNSFFFRTDSPIEFRGTMNEDVVTYTTEGSRGNLFLTYTKVMINQAATQSIKGGMSEAYLDGGTYLKSFYAVMSMPSAVKVGLMTSGHSRIHHRISWNNCVPKIISEKWRRNE